MIGIYSWKNNINGKRYIGQSIDIERRRKQHIYNAGKLDTKLSQALYKYGVNNFTFEVLEETTIELLNERENYWITYFDAIKNGYNITSMENNTCTIYGEYNPNTNLTNEMVLEIRNRIFLDNEYIWEVYEDYNHLIGKDRFWSMVHGETWKNVDCSMIKSLVNNNGDLNPNANLNSSTVLEIRNRIYVNKEEPLTVYQDYKDLISYSAYCKMYRGDTWQTVDCSMITKIGIQRKGKPKAKLSKQEVGYIRYLYENNLKTKEELYKMYPEVTPKTISRVLNYETWKDIKPVSTISEA